MVCANMQLVKLCVENCLGCTVEADCLHVVNDPRDFLT